MSTQYVTDEGLQIPTVTEILEDLNESLRSNISPLLDVSPESPVGQLTGIYAERIRSLYEVVKIGFDANDPESAFGVLLDGVCAITGTRRAKATASSFKASHSLDLDLDSSTTVPAGTKFTTELGAPVFELLDDVTSTFGGTYPGEAVCIELGPVACNADTLVIIVDSVAGLNAVNNPYKATLGRDEDTDDELRLRRENELSDLGECTLAALQAGLLAYRNEQGEAPILTAKIFENSTAYWNASLPPHSFEALVFDGVGEDAEDSAIADVIWANKPLGIQAFGSTSVEIQDEIQGTQVVKFSRPAIVDVKVNIVVLVDPATYQGDDAVKAKIVNRFSKRVDVGEKVYAEDYSGAVIVNVAGVVDVPVLQLGRVGGSFGVNKANLTIDSREIALLQSADIAVTVLEV